MTYVYGTTYSRMDQVKFFKFCLLQILFRPFLNTLSHVWIRKDRMKNTLETSMTRKCDFQTGKVLIGKCLLTNRWTETEINGASYKLT